MSRDAGRPRDRGFRVAAGWLVYGFDLLERCVDNVAKKGDACEASLVGWMLSWHFGIQALHKLNLIDITSVYNIWGMAFGAYIYIYIYIYICRAYG